MKSLDTIPLDKIDVGDDFNPRTTADVDDGFLASVQTHGIITPILLQPQGSGASTRYFLVAGERRYRAAVKVGLTEIPAVIRTEFPTGQTLPTALVENMQRQQLSPIEEAHAFQRAHDDGLTGEELAEAVGVSLDTIRQRVRLLELPGKVQELVGAGDVTLKTAGDLRQLAPFGETIVAKTAELLVAGQDESSWDEPIVPGDLTQNPEWMLERVVSELGDDAPFLFHLRKGDRIQLEGYGAVKWPDGVDVAPVAEKLRALPPYGPDYKPIRGAALEIKQEDIDAARAYGCLVELGDHLYLTDPVWLLDLLDGKADKAISSWNRKQKKAAKSNGADDAAAVDPADAAREQKRQERTEQRAAQLSARERNISLRHALMDLTAPEITLEAVQAVGELLLQYAADDLGQRGWRFVDERAETVTAKKNGEISSLAYDRGAGGLLHGALQKAETPERALGVLLQALVAARFADKQAARQSDRYGDVRGMGEWAANKQLVSLVEAIAEPILPPDITLELRERRDREAVELDRYRTQLRDDLTKSDFPSRVRRGEDSCPNCGGGETSGLEDGGFTPCACSDEEILDAAIKCPRCGEPECFATCTGYQLAGDVEETLEPAAA
jgi:ParB/RepB/Spo0J family partition protein